MWLYSLQLGVIMPVNYYKHLTQQSKGPSLNQLKKNIEPMLDMLGGCVFLLSLHNCSCAQ